MYICVTHFLKKYAYIDVICTMHTAYLEEISHARGPERMSQVHGRRLGYSRDAQLHVESKNSPAILKPRKIETHRKT